MASKAFLEQIRKAREAKSIDSVLVGSGFLDEGTHDVTVTAVDTTKMGETKEDGSQNLPHLVVTFSGEGGRQHNERLYLTNREGSELGFGLRMFISGCLPNTEALDALFEFLDQGDFKALEMFTGMKARISLAHDSGFIVKVGDDKKFRAYDVKTGELLDKDTEGFVDAKAAADDAKAAGNYRSYVRMKRLEATHEESNTAAFNAAAAARKQTKTAGSGSGAAKSGGRAAGLSRV